VKNGHLGYNSFVDRSPRFKWSSTVRQFIWLLVCLVTLTQLSAEEVRTWTDVNGRKMQAQFIREVDGDVTFIKDGKLITFPLDQLSDDDQKHIREAETGKKVEEPTTPAGAPRKEISADTSLTPADIGSMSESKARLIKERTDADNRTWRDYRGRQTVGKFVRMHQGNVVVLSGARAVSIPFDSLSRPDQEYLRELLTARGEASQLPFSPSAEPNAIVESQPGAGSEPIASPPEAPAAPSAGSGPPIGRGGGGSDANERLAKMQEENRQRMAESNERLAKMQEENRQRMAEANERREKMVDLAQQGLQRMKSNLPSHQESPQDIVGNCGNCKTDITREHSQGMKCPHCGVIWQYEVDEFGNKKEIPGAAAAIAAAESSATSGQNGNAKTGWEIEPRHYGKLFTRIIIPIAVMLCAAIAAAVRGRL
jgi:hypothetical protein